MTQVMLIIGLTLVLLGTFGLMRDIAAKGRSALVFLLPLAGLRHVQENWSDIWWAALMRVFGVALILLGLGLAVARDPQLLHEPQRVFGATGGGQEGVLAGSQRAALNAFVSSEEAIRIAIRNDANPRLSGSVNGHTFQYDRAELINGVFSAQQGEGFIPDLEVRILLRENPMPITQRRTLLVRPGDEMPPEIHLSWREQGRDLPETLIITEGYRMELHLAPLDHNQLTGFLQLILPDTRRSFLSGDFTAHTNHLRYLGNQVDLTFDHPDTLNYLVREHLRGQFPEGMISRIEVLDTRMQRREQTGSSRVRVTLRNGRVEERLLRLERSSVGWAMRPGATEITVVEAGERGDLRLITAAPQRKASDSEAGAAVPPPPPITRSFTDFGEYTGQQVELLRVDGSRQTGIVRSVNSDRLMLETTVGSGSLAYTVTSEELVMLQLSSGQQVYAEGHAPPGPAATQQSVTLAPEKTAQQGTADERALDESAMDERATEADQPASTALSDEHQQYKKLIGRQVRISGHDGRVRTGVLRNVDDRQLTLEVPVGAGALEYYYRPDEIANLEQVTHQ
ncbi:hypothetical protein K8B33_00875 [Alcanivorax sp. JB21]|uniref:hypothetical protein n=1 Tax=Alcanivorax limicola TaxID=2874102 RepID=UPI001CBFA22D|nr:hypothetical protein [Alcanivorax limicola]MBZ2187636.1 hypothetical protein [Alcanivorax limicola]